MKTAFIEFQSHPIRAANLTDQQEHAATIGMGIEGLGQELVHLSPGIEERRNQTVETLSRGNVFGSDPDKLWYRMPPLPGPMGHVVSPEAAHDDPVRALAETMKWRMSTGIPQMPERSRGLVSPPIKQEVALAYKKPDGTLGTISLHTRAHGGDPYSYTIATPAMPLYLGVNAPNYPSMLKGTPENGTVIYRMQNNRNKGIVGAAIGKGQEERPISREAALALTEAIATGTPFDSTRKMIVGNRIVSRNGVIGLGARAITAISQKIS